jgi:vacuolar protein sorting-associated protein 72
MLEQFEGLEVVATTSKRGSTRSSKDARLLEPTAIASKLLPLSYPSFNEEETRYLTAKLKKTKAPKDVLPPAPVKTRCALTGWPAKFRDPKTGLPYSGLMEYKMVHRLLAGGCQWSAMLGCWVGPAYGSMGRPAKGVPDAFGLSLANQPAPPVEDAADKVKIESMS